MLMPAIAFSWWVMSQPTESGHTAPPHRTTGEAVAMTHGSDSDPSPGSPASAFAATPAESTDAVAAQLAPSTDTSSNGSGERTLYRGVITAEIARVARSFLDLPMGAERFADVEGQHFVFVLQRHYHPPGFVGAPTGWHKGVTVYALR